MAATGKRTSPIRNSFHQTRTATPGLPDSPSGKAYKANRSIRSQLIVTFILLVLVTVVITSSVAGLLVTQSGQQQVTKQLEAVSALKEARIDAWLQDIQHNLQMLVTIQGQPDQLWMIEELIASDQNLDQGNQNVSQTLRERFLESMRATPIFEEIFLIDLNGKILVSTDSNQDGKDKHSRDYFTNGVETPYISPVYRSAELGLITMVASSPIQTMNGEALAVVAGRVNMAVLNEIMLQQAGLGETGEIYLIAENHIILSPSRFDGSSPRETYFFSQTVSDVLAQKTTGSRLYNGYQGVPVIGVYRWLPELQMALLTEQYQSEALTTTRATLFANTITAAVAMLVALLIGLLATRRITYPLQNLAETAEQIAAGNLGLTAKIEREDEIGALAYAFNSMTFQLRNLITGLENRVMERTRELENRSTRLRIAAQIARDTSRSSNLDELLTTAALLIRDRFNYYHVGIFLRDERGEFAILKSAAGAAGLEMLEQGYRQKVGEYGLIGSAVGDGKTRVANKRDLETSRFNNPLLPDSQSEATILLRIGDRVTGALDLHSIRDEDFENDTIEVLQTMADQLAVAIENMRLLDEMQETVRKLESAYGQYTAGTWQSFVQRTRRLRGLRYRGLQSEPPGGMTKEAVEALQLHKTILGEKRVEANSEIMRNTLAIPMKLRGQTLGVINVEFEGYRPSAETVAFYEEVTERLALALDNVRLIEETNLRSEQLKLLQEITAAAASHVNLENLFDDVTARIREGFDADHCGVILFDPGRHTGTLVSSNSATPISPAQHLLGTKIPLQEEQMLSDIIQSQKSRILPGMGVEAGEGPFNELLDTLRATTHVFIPLTSRGELLGVIMMNVSDPERHFGEDDLRLMDQISLQITTAIEVARVFERLERRAQRERQISEITSKVRSSTNVDIILQTAVQELAEALDVPKGTINLRHTTDSPHE
jgi:GAF domain-containing protein/HAMP domain-containing protein